MLCVFDFDGTIVDSKTPYYLAVKQYATENFFPLPSIEEMNRVYGSSGDLAFLGWNMGSKKFNRNLHKIFDLTDEIALKDLTLTPIFDGMVALIKKLIKDEFTLAIVTSRRVKPLKALLEHHGLSEYFTSFRTFDDLKERGYRGKPHPDKLFCIMKELNKSPDNTVMIGDSLMDIEMANNSNVSSIGVSWGFCRAEVLKVGGAQIIVDNVKELEEAIYKKFE